MALTLPQLEGKYFPAHLDVGQPHSGDTDVIPHIDGISYFGAIAEALDRCTVGVGDKIYICGWWFDPLMRLTSASSALPLGEILVGKAAMGADVRIILWTGRFFTGGQDWAANLPSWWVNLAIANIPRAKDFTQVVRENIDAVLALRSMSATPNGTAPLVGRVLMDWGCSSGGTRHEKSTVIYSASNSDLRAFVGGMDYKSDRMDDEFHASQNKWHDVGVELCGGGASSVLGNFRTRWEEAATLPKRRYRLHDIGAFFNPIIEQSAPSPPATPNAVSSEFGVRIVRSYGTDRSLNLLLEGKNIAWSTIFPGGIRELQRVLQNGMDRASKYIYVEDQALNFSFPIQVLSHSLLYPKISSACARGVKVIFVCPGKGDPMGDTGSLPAMCAQIVETILKPLSTSQRENFVLYRITETIVHAKVVLVDDELAVIGSGNFFDRSMSGQDTELNAAIVGGSFVADLRTRLWRGHLRVASDPLIDSEIRALDKSLAIFRESWGSGITFPHADSALQEMNNE